MADSPSTPFKPKLLKSLEHDSQLWQARFSPGGKMLVAPGYNGSIERWLLDGAEFKKLAPIVGHHGWVQSVDFDPAGELLYAGDSWGQLSCWRFLGESPAEVWTKPAAHPAWIRGVAVSPDGKLLATCGNDTAVRIWSSADGAPTRELDGHATKVFSVAFHPGGKSLVTGDLKGAVREWDLESGKLVRQLDASVLYQCDKIQECGGARQLAFDTQGKHLLVSGQKTPTGGFATGLPAVLLFDWASGKQLQEMQAGGKEDGFVYDACFHPAGFVMAASCAFPGKGHLWFWKPGEDKAFYLGGEWPNSRSLSMHPDGRLALLVSLSANMNGRGDGPYLDGTSKIQILEFASGVA